MNPNEILNQMRKICMEWRNDERMDDRVAMEQLVELISLLDEQMCDGILPPDDWSAYITPTQRQYGKRYTP